MKVFQSFGMRFHYKKFREKKRELLIKTYELN